MKDSKPVVPECSARNTVIFPDIRQPNIQFLRYTLSMYNWGAVVHSDEDIEMNYNCFHAILTELISMRIPTRQITLRKSPLVKHLLRKRNKCCHKGQMQQAHDLSVKITKLITDMKKKTFDSSERMDSRKLWQTINKKTNYKTTSGLHNFVDISENACADIIQHFTNITTNGNYNIDEFKTRVDFHALTSLGCDDVEDLQTYEVLQLL